jgi:hypothetical protein
MAISTHQVRPFDSAQAALAFITAGRSHFTLVSKQTGKRYTYRVARLQQEGSRQPGPLLASVLYGQDNGSDYRYVGVVGSTGRLRFTAKSKVTCDDPRGAGLAWALDHLVQRAAIPPQLEVWHEGRCGRCARRLTDPASLARGLGPECYGKAA